MEKRMQLPCCGVFRQASFENNATFGTQLNSKMSGNEFFHRFPVPRSLLNSKLGDAGLGRTRFCE